MTSNTDKYTIQILFNMPCALKPSHKTKCNVIHNPGVKLTHLGASSAQAGGASHHPILELLPAPVLMRVDPRVQHTDGGLGCDLWRRSGGAQPGEQTSKQI